MTQSAEITYTPTCANCPLARHIDGDRYECTAVHNHHNSVVRGHWASTPICDEAIEGFYQDAYESEMSAILYDSTEEEIMQLIGLVKNPSDYDWLTQPIGSNPDFIFGNMTGEQQAEILPPWDNGYHDPNWNDEGCEF